MERQPFPLHRDKTGLRSYAPRQRTLTRPGGIVAIAANHDAHTISHCQRGVCLPPHGSRAQGISHISASQVETKQRPWLTDLPLWESYISHPTLPAPWPERVFHMEDRDRSEAWSPTPVGISLVRKSRHHSLERAKPPRCNLQVRPVIIGRCRFRI